jgi:hypothetical protein
VPYKPSESRYSGGGKTKYLVYTSPQPLRDGRTQRRTRVKRIYFPANATAITVGPPATYRRRTGTRVFGVPVSYRSRLSATSGRRGDTRFTMPPHTAEREQIVELPRGATGVKIVDRPPEGPRMAVR